MKQTQNGRITLDDPQWHETGKVLTTITQSGPLITVKSQPIIITLPSEATGETLSNFLRVGRQYHPLCRHSFVERVQVGYYFYERREEWRTCALAAAYAGAFGPGSIERPEFSYSMVVWRLSQRVGFDISAIAEKMITLVDENFWTRAGVAEWLESMGI